MTSGKKNMQRSLENLTIYPTSEVYKWATTLVVATHPDEEIMGCGGAIALLRQMGYRVHILFLCDGSHAFTEHSYLSPKCMCDLRKLETENALSILGISEESITYLDVNDTMLSFRNKESFSEVVQLFRNKIADLIPDTVLFPWQYNGQKKNQVVRQIIEHTLLQETYRYNLIEYSLRPWIDNKQLQALAFNEDSPWRLDNKPVLEHKMEALSKYRLREMNLNLEQEKVNLTDFVSSEMLACLIHPWEIYLHSHF